MENIWRIIQEKLKQNYPDDYILWFSQLEFEKITSKNLLILNVSSKTIQKNIMERFSSLIEQTAQEVLGFEPKLQINIKENEEFLFTNISSIEIEEVKIQKKIKTPKKGFLSDGISLNPKFTFERFVPGSNSDLAYKAAQFIVQIDNGIYERFNPFFIYGGVGLGKTHILQAIGNYINQKHKDLTVIYTTAEKYMNDYIEASITKKFQNFRDYYRNTDILLIDDIQFLENREKLQDEIFNNFNHLHQNNKQIVFTCDKHPKDLKNVQERLISRFSWGLSVDIKTPDFETRRNILIKKLDENNILKDISTDVIDYLAENITQNIRDIESAVIKISSILLLIQEPITLSLVQEELKDILTKTKVESLGIDILTVQEIVSNYYSSESKKITVADLKSKSRINNIVFARHMSIYIIKNIYPYSLSKIGENFGDRDHSTILSSIRKIEKEIKSTVSVRHDYEEILKLLTQY